MEPVDADEGIAGVGNRLPAGGNLPQSPSRSSPIFSYPPISFITSLLFILISLPLYLLRFYTMSDGPVADIKVDKVADMEVNMVADMEVNMVANKRWTLRQQIVLCFPKKDTLS